MPSIVDKSLIKMVCVDDFAFRKRYSYGTVMVDIESHRIIDIIESRETATVTEWLKTYPNLSIISRDGAQAYASASSNSHPEALQISDRFHLLKNLSDAIEKYMRRLFPSRLEIPATEATQSPAMQALYNTSNRSERIKFAQLKRDEGYTINDIALLLHSSVTTISKYLAIPKDEIPKEHINSREARYQDHLMQKQKAIDEVRNLYAGGHSIEEITRITGHGHVIVKKYLKKDCPIHNGHYDTRMPGKLAPYEQYVVTMRAEGITYFKIHEMICALGYNGTVSSLRVFMQKERTHQKAVNSITSESKEYIPRKFMCQLIYRELEKVKGLTLEQYDAAVKKYPVLGQLYSLLKEFHRIVFSQKKTN